MKFAKISFLFSFIVCALFCLTFMVEAHSGKTDGAGGHYDRSTGEYHYHHGYSAHQHENGICPYDFKDDTEHDYKSNNSHSIVEEEIDVETKRSFWDVVGIVFGIIGSSILFSLGAIYLCYLAFSIVLAFVESVLNISVKESTWNRIWIVLVIICVVLAISISIIKRIT